MYGNVRIDANGIENISGMSKMIHVGGSLQIFMNVNLPFIIGLSEFTNVDGELSIRLNKKLVNVADLNKLTNLGSLNIGGNDVLSDITWLS